jgi:hypothetical protein
VGQAYPTGESANFALARLHPNGDLDTSFGDNGVVLTEFGPSQAPTTRLCSQMGRFLSLALFRTFK